MQEPDVYLGKAEEELGMACVVVMRERTSRTCRVAVCAVTTLPVIKFTCINP